MFWFPNYFQHILVWASACKVLQHSMPCDTRNLVKHVGIILCMLTISNVYVYIYICIYVCMCVFCTTSESNQQPAMLAHQQALSASNAGTTAELTQKTLSQQLAANILCHTFFHRFFSNGFSLDAKSHASKFDHICLVVSLDNFIQ